MNTIGKAVNNGSGFFGGENPVSSLTLVLYQADSPFGGAVPFQCFHKHSVQISGTALDLGAGLDCRPCGSHSMAYVQLLISVGHLLWPPDDADASS